MFFLQLFDYKYINTAIEIGRTKKKVLLNVYQASLLAASLFFILILATVNVNTLNTLTQLQAKNLDKKKKCSEYVRSLGEVQIPRLVCDRLVQL